ncbi:unnamed protein product [Enterobius vermicularis]|uniref:Uncharacterized protein n=1 Tax=Enterobius vermicularis TaxID=51028 RepID=A0A0N4V1T1_ENTVE|nr:unnamed protein product [Enterobius vermicularis]
MYFLQRNALDDTMPKISHTTTEACTRQIKEPLFQMSENWIRTLRLSSQTLLLLL